MKHLLAGFLILISLFTNGQTGISNDTLHWSSSRMLTWADFKGEPIEGIGLIGEAFCMNLANFEKPNMFNKTNFKVIALFDKTKSWINEKNKTEIVLRYFQVMFNIYEVHARSLRRDLSTTKFGADPNPVFQEKYNQSMTNLMNEFNQFRKETKMGLDVNSLDSWKIKVDKALKNLENYR